MRAYIFFATDLFFYHRCTDNYLKPCVKQKIQDLRQFKPVENSQLLKTSQYASLCALLEVTLI